MPADLGTRLADGYARPAFGRFAQATQSLNQDLGKWCARPDAAGAAQVRTGFAQVARAWAGVEFLRFGPLVQGNRYERLAFWPDTRNVMARQVQAALAAADPALLAPGALAGRSVALQGLPALEFVLYGETGLLQQPDAPGFAYGCQLAHAMARNAAGLAGELAQAWSAQGDFGRQFTHPAPANDLYRSPQEVAAEAVKALSTGLQFARDVKLLPVLGESAAAARPKRAAFWRSGQTAATLAAGL
ncbi:imelysin family protein, partial [Bordetella pertussis]